VIWKYTTTDRNIVISEDGRQSGIASTLVQSGDTVLEPDAPTIAERLAALTAAIDNQVESVARSLRYKSAESVAGYVNS